MKYIDNYINKPQFDLSFFDSVIFSIAELLPILMNRGINTVATLLAKEQYLSIGIEGINNTTTPNTTIARRIPRDIYLAFIYTTP